MYPSSGGIPGVYMMVPFFILMADIFGNILLTMFLISVNYLTSLRRY